MKIQSIEIVNFRSIERMSFDFENINVVCGPNSCGKSNLFKAIELALAENVGPADYVNNISRWIKSGRTQIKIEIVFSDVPESLRGASRKSKLLKYRFSLTQSGKVSRSFDVKNKSTDEIFELLRNSLLLTFVPAIRDWSSDGLATFQRVILEALLKSRGDNSLNTVTSSLRKMLDQRSPTLLNKQKDVAYKLFTADSMLLDTSGLNLNFISSQISLKVKKGSDEILLEELGTGHQSALIMGLYQQLGESQGRSSIFIFEEPDNHLHPATIRSVVNDLILLSRKSQVFISTHSPLVLNQVDFSNIHSLSISDDGKTRYHPLKDLATTLPQKEIRRFLEKYGVRATEPLLNKRVIIVEGLTDKTFISKLFELEYEKSVDSENFLIIPAGGKDEAVHAVNIMRLMGVDWRVLFDWDASSKNHRKNFVDIANQFEKNNLLDGIYKAFDYVDSSHKRGHKAAIALKRLIEELENPGLQTGDSYQDSAINLLVRDSISLSAADKSAVKIAVKAKQIRKLNQLLAKENAYILKLDLEDLFLSTPEITLISEASLAKLGLITIDTARPQIQRNKQIRKAIHNLAHMPKEFEEVIAEVYKKTRFKGTSALKCVDFLMR